MRRGGMIDCDVHHRWKTAEELTAYLSPRWRAYVEDAGISLGSLGVAYPHIHGVNKRIDSFPPDGSEPGSDYETLRIQLLDGLGVDHAILGYDIGSEAGAPNPYLGVDIARAANDWSLDKWLSRGDDRLYGAILVSAQLPSEAAREIRRVAVHERMVEVRLVADPLGLPFGHPIFEPIFEAAAEVGLPVGIHLGSADSTRTAATSLPATRFEYHTLAGQGLMTHLASILAHGVLDRFPTLKVVIIEGGVAWLPWLLRSLDAQWANLRREVPTIRRLPSQAMRESVRLTTQPLELSPLPHQLVELLETVPGIDDLLCFASDYPHWDADDPRAIAKLLPPAWTDKLFRDNALNIYWPKETAAKSNQGAATAVQ